MSRSKRRHSIAILADLLSILNSRGPLRKTRLMNYANLNPRTFKSYMSQLINSGLVTVSEENTYTLTSRGTLFLSLYNTLMRTVDHYSLSSVRRRIEDIASKLSQSENLSRSYMLSASSGVKFYYDLLLTKDSRPRLAIVILDETTSTGIRGAELGSLLLSCIENRELNHLVIAGHTLEPTLRRILSRANASCNVMIVRPEDEDEIGMAIRKAIEHSRRE